MESDGVVQINVHHLREQLKQSLIGSFRSVIVHFVPATRRLQPLCLCFCLRLGLCVCICFGLHLYICLCPYLFLYPRLSPHLSLFPLPSLPPAGHGVLQSVLHILANNPQICMEMPKLTRPRTLRTASQWRRKLAAIHQELVDHELRGNLHWPPAPAEVPALATPAVQGPTRRSHAQHGQYAAPGALCPGLVFGPPSAAADAPCALLFEGLPVFETTCDRRRLAPLRLGALSRDAQCLQVRLRQDGLGRGGQRATERRGGGFRGQSTLRAKFRVLNWPRNLPPKIQGPPRNWHPRLRCTAPAKPYTPQHFSESPRNLPHKSRGSRESSRSEIYHRGFDLPRSPSLRLYGAVPVATNVVRRCVAHFVPSIGDPFADATRCLSHRHIALFAAFSGMCKSFWWSGHLCTAVMFECSRVRGGDAHTPQDNTAQHPLQR